MKGKVLSAILVFVLLFGSGCGNQPQDHDAPERISTQRFSEFCVIQGTGYFLHRRETGEKYLYYYDRKGDTIRPLCGRAECTHDLMDCNAWIGEGLGLGVSDGNLYWVGIDFSDGGGGWYIFREKTDGRNRKRLLKLAGVNENILPLSNSMILYDEANMVICGNRSEIIDGEEVLYAELQSYSLKNGERKTLYQKKCQGVPVIQIFQGQVYLSVVEQRITEKDGEYLLSSDLELVRYPIEGGEGEVLYKGRLDFVPYAFYILDDRILMTAVSSGDNQVYAFHFEDQTIAPELLFSEEEDYEVLFLEDDRIIGYTYPKLPDFKTKKLKVTDFEGNLILEEESEEKMLDQGRNQVFGRLFYGSDEDGLYFVYEDNSEPQQLKQRIVRYSLKDGRATELDEDW